MTILLNNRSETFSVPDAHLTVTQLLAAKGWSFPLIIVKVNGTLTGRDKWATALVRDGDTVEALHLVSGG